MADFSYLVNQIKAVPAGLRLRLGKVITVNADRTMDIQISGDTNTLPGVNYLSHTAPKPNDQVWLINNGPDLLGVGMVAGASRTLSPKAYRTSLVTIPANTETIVSFQAVENDDWSCWSGTNPSRLTVPVTGRYLVHAQTKWEDGAAGTREASLKVNGSYEIAYSDCEKSRTHGAHNNLMSPPITLTKGDYVELQVYTKVSLNLIVTADGDSYVGWMPSLSLIYLGS